MPVEFHNKLAALNVEHYYPLGADGSDTIGSVAIAPSAVTFGQTPLTDYLETACSLSGLNQYIDLNNLRPSLAGQSFGIGGMAEFLPNGTQPALFSINTSTGGNVLLVLARATGFSLYDGTIKVHNESGFTPQSGEVFFWYLWLDNSSKEVTFYINGQAKGTFAITRVMAGDDNVQLGMEMDSGLSTGDFWQGRMSSVFVTLQNLTATQINELYLAATTAPAVYTYVAGTIELDDSPVSRAVLALSYQPQDVDGEQQHVVLSHGSSAVDGTFNLALGGFTDPVLVLALDNFGDSWQANKQYSVGDIVHPTSSDKYLGFVYECTVAGQSGAAEPVWWVDNGGSNTGISGTATFSARQYYQPLCHGPVIPVVQSGD